MVDGVLLYEHPYYGLKIRKLRQMCSDNLPFYKYSCQCTNKRELIIFMLHCERRARVVASSSVLLSRLRNLELESLEVLARSLFVESPETLSKKILVRVCAELMHDLFGGIEVSDIMFMARR